MRKLLKRIELKNINMFREGKKEVKAFNVGEFLT